MGMFDATVKKNLVLAANSGAVESVEIGYSKIGKEM